MFKPYINVFWFVFYFIERIAYMQSLPLLPGCIHYVRRINIFNDVLKVYSEWSILEEYPIRISFENELAIDQGGVTREMFAAFWEECYSQSSK